MKDRKDMLFALESDYADEMRQMGFAMLVPHERKPQIEEGLLEQMSDNEILILLGMCRALHQINRRFKAIPSF